ncbi:MAG: hypothetical protein ACJ8GW_03590 [Massilia sp.]
MSVWLLAIGARRMAFLWSVLFCLAMGLAAANKVAYLAWGGGWQALCYKALSGHATGASAVLPVLAFVLAQGRAKTWQYAAVAGALALAALLAAALVSTAQHSAAEALGGWCTGAAASLAALRFGGKLPDRQTAQGAWAAAFTLGIGLCILQAMPLAYWMVHLARLVAGNTPLFNLHSH